MDNGNISERRPFVVLLGLDLVDTASSAIAFDQAAQIASRIEPSQVHAVYALPEDATDAAVRQAEGLLRMYVSEKAAALDIAGPMFGVHVRRGDAAREVAQMATELSADMIIVGTHKIPKLKTIFIGSHAQRIMAHTKCPVLVAGPRPPPEPSHIIVIEPPCPECVRTRSESQNRTFWCARHSEHHHMHKSHVYSYASELPFSSADMAVDPRGGCAYRARAE